MNYQIEHELLKLTCRICRTKDLGDTSEYKATKLGWTDIVEARQPHEQQLHMWWAHEGLCPKCRTNKIRRLKEHQQMSTRTMGTLLNAAAIATLVIGAIVLVSETTQAAAPPVPVRPLPDDMGACCYGSKFTVVFTTRRECNTGVDSPTNRPGMFVNGAVPTMDENPCARLAGGD
jgi:hypothetical protein